MPVGDRPRPDDIGAAGAPSLQSHAGRCPPPRRLWRRQRPAVRSRRHGRLPRSVSAPEPMATTTMAPTRTRSKPQPAADEVALSSVAPPPRAATTAIHHRLVPTSAKSPGSCLPRQLPPPPACSPEQGPAGESGRGICRPICRPTCRGTCRSGPSTRFREPRWSEVEPAPGDPVECLVPSGPSNGICGHRAQLTARGRPMERSDKPTRHRTCCRTPGSTRCCHRQPDVVLHAPRLVPTSAEEDAAAVALLAELVGQWERHRREPESPT